MPQTDHRKPGSFCWIELATTDQNVAKSFYSGLFDWSHRDDPIGPTDFYTMFSLDGGYVGAAYTQRGDEITMGIPPHWNLYIEVQSADETAAKAGALGAKILVPAFDVAEHGRMAVIADPQGAVFCIWEPKRHEGFQVSNRHGAFCWADLNTPDPDAGTKFYGELFGWTFTTGEGGYQHIHNGEAPIGGVPPRMPPNAPPHWMIYLQTDDCAATVAKATEGGGKVCMGPVTMENIGTFAVLTDPQQAAFAIFTPMQGG